MSLEWWLGLLAIIVPLYFVGLAIVLVVAWFHDDAVQRGKERDRLFHKSYTRRPGAWP